MRELNFPSEVKQSDAPEWARAFTEKCISELNEEFGVDGFSVEFIEIHIGSGPRRLTHRVALISSVSHTASPDTTDKDAKP